MDIKNNAIARRLAINANNAQKNDIDVIKDALVSGVLQKKAKPSLENDRLGTQKEFGGGLSATSKLYYDEK